MIEKITTYSENETIELAQNIESEKFPNMVICLMGDLGTGKTVFTKGFAQALEVTEEVINVSIWKDSGLGLDHLSSNLEHHVASYACDPNEVRTSCL